ncbi:MAG: GNAT family N-acetyltransferase [Rhodospirillales bacterium]|nr:GNAT family N-acetyltransferase [Rhodospirillales bacterium]
MPPGVVLRDAKPGDEALVLHFVRRLAEYERLTHEAVGTEADFARALFAPVPRAHALIIEKAGEAVGFALWYYNFSTFKARPGLYLEDIFVEPEHRGGGIGKAVFRALAARAVAEGCARMNWQVLDWNAPSIAFYRGLGARPLDDWTTMRLEGETLAALAA